MNGQNCHCNDAYPDRVSACVGHIGSSGSLARRHRFAWRSALASLASPMVRLHHLRNVRTQMLREALADLDGCENTEGPGNDA